MNMSFLKKTGVILALSLALVFSAEGCTDEANQSPVSAPKEDKTAPEATQQARTNPNGTNGGTSSAGGSKNGGNSSNAGDPQQKPEDPQANPPALETQQEGSSSDKGTSSGNTIAGTSAPATPLAGSNTNGTNGGNGSAGRSGNGGNPPKAGGSGAPNENPTASDTPQEGSNTDGTNGGNGNADGSENDGNSSKSQELEDQKSASGKQSEADISRKIEGWIEDKLTIFSCAGLFVAVIIIVVIFVYRRKIKAVLARMIRLGARDTRVMSENTNDYQRTRWSGDSCSDAFVIPEETPKETTLPKKAGELDLERKKSAKLRGCLNKIGESVGLENAAKEPDPEKLLQEIVDRLKTQPVSPALLKNDAGSQQKLENLRKELSNVRQELDNVQQERNALRAEKATLTQERDSALAERDQALQAEEARAARELAAEEERKQRELADAQRKFADEKAALEQAHGRALAEKDSALRAEKDRAARELAATEERKQRELAAAQRKFDDEKSALKQAHERALAERDSLLVEEQKKTDKVLTNLLPNVEGMPDASQWRNALTGANVSANRLLALSKLSALKAAVALKNRDSQIKELYDFGVSFFACAVERGLSPTEAQAEAKEYVKGFNEKFIPANGGDYKLSLPEISAPFDSSSMTPSPDGEKLGKVVEIKSWGIFTDAEKKRKILKYASVKLGR